MIEVQRMKRKMSSSTKMYLIFVLIFFGILSALLTTYHKMSVSSQFNLLMYLAKEDAKGARCLDAINANSIKKYKETLIIDDEYRSVIKKLDEYVQDIEAWRILVIAPFNSEYNIYIYGSSKYGDGIEDSVYGRKKLGDKCDIDNLSTDIFSGNKDYKDSDIFKNEDGYICSGVAPIKDENDKVIAFIKVDYDMNNELKSINKELNRAEIVITIFFISLVGFSFLLMKKYLTNPMKEITFAVNHVVNSERTKISKQTIDVTYKNDDVAILANVFNKMISDLRAYTENIKKMSAEKEQISTELNIANEIQTSLIPQTFPAFPELKEIDMYANSKPARKVGGDFYDFFLIDNDHLAFTIADVSGKGISAALFMVIARTLIRNETSPGKTPGEILGKVNEQMCLENDLGMFLTLFLGILNFKTGELQFSNAGHLKPIYKFKNNKFKEIKLNKNFVIAGMPNLKFKDEKLQMSPNDIIFMYTDGITESFDKDNTQSLGTTGLINLLNSVDTSQSTLKSIVKLVQKEVEKVSNGNQFDDETILVIKFKGENHEQ